MNKNLKIIGISILAGTILVAGAKTYKDINELINTLNPSYLNTLNSTQESSTTNNETSCLVESSIPISDVEEILTNYELTTATNRNETTTNQDETTSQDETTNQNNENSNYKSSFLYDPIENFAIPLLNSILSRSSSFIEKYTINNINYFLSPVEDRYSELYDYQSIKLTKNTNSNTWNKESILYEDMLKRGDIDLYYSLFSKSVKKYNSITDIVMLLTYANLSGETITISPEQYDGNIVELYNNLITYYRTYICADFDSYDVASYPSESNGYSMYPTISDDNIITIQPCYNRTEEKKQDDALAKTKLREIGDEIRANTPKDATEYEVATKVVNAIKEMGTYEPDQNSLLKLVNDNVANCATFSSALSYLGKYLGLNICASLSCDHSWAIAKLDGNYYCIDLAYNSLRQKGLIPAEEFYQIKGKGNYVPLTGCENETVLNTMEKISEKNNDYTKLVNKLIQKAIYYISQGKVLLENLDENYFRYLLENYPENEY